MQADPTNRIVCPANDHPAPPQAPRTAMTEPSQQRNVTVAMAILFIFMLGVGNFAMQGAVLDSGHPLLDQAPWFYHALNRRLALVVEFLMLLAGLLLAAEGQFWAALAYLGYSLMNAVSAWLILTRRI